MHNITNTVKKISNLDHQGRGIYKNDTEIIFIDNALEDEEVVIKTNKQKKNIKWAETVEIIKTSQDRVSPICPYYKLCGGCNIMHMSSEKQKSFKQNKVKEILKKFGNIDIEIKSIISSNCINYRNKATFQVREKIGYYKNNTYDIVNIDKCFIVDEKINEILKQLKNFNLKNIYQIVIRVTSHEIMVVLKVNGNIDRVIIDELKDKVDSIILYDKNYVTLFGKDKIVEEIGQFKYLISPDSFFQVNTKTAELLYNEVKRLASLNKDDSVLDLYCGTGSIGIYLSRECEKVLGVEINKYAIEDAVENRKLNNIENIDFICADVSDISDIVNDKYDVVIVDPPRNGLDKKTILFLNNSNFKKIVYVSCDPVTLARDLKELDYDIKEIIPVDMFKETYHVECVLLLVRKTLEK